MEDARNNSRDNSRKEDEPAAIKEQLDKAKKELEEEKNRHLRTRADFENYRKRIGREAESSRIGAKKEILLDLLSFLTFFEQAKKQVKEPAAAQGIEIMARQFYELLYKHGVRPIDCLGEPFDPEEQEGLGYVTTEDFPEGCVAEELYKGYKLDDKLLRPAQVMVAQKPSG